MISSFRSSGWKFEFDIDDDSRSVLLQLIDDLAHIAGVELPDDDVDTSDPLWQLEQDFAGPKFALYQSDSSDDDGEATPTTLDPAVYYLYPALNEGIDLDDDLRRQSMSNLNGVKVRAYTHVKSRLSGPAGTISFPEDEVESWMVTLNDLRLVIAARLGITEDHDAENVGDLADSDTAQHQAQFYQHLSWWLDSLIRASQRRQRGY